MAFEFGFAKLDMGAVHVIDSFGEERSVQSQNASGRDGGVRRVPGRGLRVGQGGEGLAIQAGAGPIHSEILPGAGLRGSGQLRVGHLERMRAGCKPHGFAAGDRAGVDLQFGGGVGTDVESVVAILCHVQFAAIHQAHAHDAELEVAKFSLKMMIITV